MQTVGDLVTRGLVVKNTDDRRAAGFGFMDQFHHRGAIFAIQRGGGLVEKQNRVVNREAAGDVNPLLFAAGKSRGGEVPQAFGYVQPR